MRKNKYKIYMEGIYIGEKEASSPIIALCKAGLFKDILSDDPDIKDVGKGKFESRNGIKYETI